MCQSISKTCVISLLLANATLSYAGGMGEVDSGKRFFFSAAPIYGSLSDASLDKIVFADTIGAGGAIRGNEANVDSRWGYSLSAGYQFGPERHHDLVLSYTHLSNRGDNVVTNGNANDILINRLSQIVRNDEFGFPQVSTGGAYLYGPATAAMMSHYDYQTGDLITHRNWQSTFLENVHFSRFYGIKATQFKKDFFAQYVGTGRGTGEFFNVITAPVNDEINYEAKYFGIGPRIGMGASWDLNRFISIGGDVSASILGGSYNSQWSETMVTSMQIQNLPASGVYTYNQSTDTSLWTSLILGTNLAVAANFDLHNGSRVGVQGGVSTEQYWTNASADSFDAKNGTNSVGVNQRFSVQNVFVKFSYLC